MFPFELCANNSFKNCNYQLGLQETYTILHKKLLKCKGYKPEDQTYIYWYILRYLLLVFIKLYILIYLKIYINSIYIYKIQILIFFFISQFINQISTIIMVYSINFFFFL